jgi:glutathione peroxidase
MNLLAYILHLTLLTSIYTYSIPVAGGGTLDMADYKGKKILIVNIASNSMYAPQLNRLEELYQKYKDSLVIIAVPSNSFTKEPLSDQQIKERLLSQYHASYLIVAKSSVSGALQLPLYKWLTLAEKNGVVNNPVTGDFQKFLINSKGSLVGIFSPDTDPLAAELQNAILNN